MAAQLYSNTKVAECLYEVLKEMVDEGMLDDNIALTVLNQLDVSYLQALQDKVTAKADIRGKLRSYKYYDNVWQFFFEDITFKLNPTGQGSAKKAPEIHCAGARVVCVDQKLAQGQAG